MYKEDAINQLGEGANLKFLMTIVPPLIHFWRVNEDGDPQHVEIADRLNLLDETLDLKPGIKAGKAKVINGDFQLTGHSSDYSNKMPTETEFQNATNGEIILINEISGDLPTFKNI